LAEVRPRSTRSPGIIAFIASPRGLLVWLRCDGRQAVLKVGAPLLDIARAQRR
jgi:hypothetical protein